jgi:hypothetical protein
MNENYNKNIYSVSDISNIDLARDNEFKLFIDWALLKHFKGNWTKAAMLSCYAHMFKKHKLNPFICEDSFFAQLYEKNIKSIEKTKKELKDEGFITTERKGLDPRKYISVNMEKVFEIYKNFGEQKSSEFLAGAQPPKITGREPEKITGGIYNNDNIIKKYNNINARESDFSRVEDKNNPIKNFENSINRKSNYLKATIKQQQNISSEEKEENKEPWEKYPAFMKLWAKTPEFSRGCGIQDAFNEWMIETENGTKNVEEVDKGLTFHFKATPKDTKTKHLTKLLMYGTWKSFLFEANEVEKKKLITEEAKKERKAKEETEEKEYTNWQNFVAKYKEEMGVDIKQMIKEKEEKQNEHYR